MKFLILLLAVISIAQSEYTEEENQKWQAFKLQHGKLFMSPNKEKERKDTFLQNAAIIEDHNEKYSNGEVSYQMGINKYSDLSEEAFMARFTGVSMPPEARNTDPTQMITLRGDPPASVDLRKYAGVGPIRDQSQCGSCWTFSTASAVEYAYWLRTGYAGDLAEQHLVDCVYGTSRSGCQGGWMAEAMNYIAKNRGIAWESDYPYVATWGSCRSDSIPSKSVWLNEKTPYVQIADDDVSIKNALNSYGVLAVCVDATGWNRYSDGIFESPNVDGTFSCTHAVSLVGYGSEKGQDFWIIRNSWNTWWGEDGYMRLAAARHGKKSRGGIMLSYALAPIIY